jgi:Ala-tRNA(Pro) deacylase
MIGRAVGLAAESDLARLFPDCEPGAAPPVGAPYGLKTLVDRVVLEQPEVFFEAGDHEHLVRMDGASFKALLGDAKVVDVGRHI